MKFDRATARIAAWNLAGFKPVSDARLANQVTGLELLDAELVTLVEVKPFAHMQKLIEGLADKGVPYSAVILPQASDLNIGFLFKDGVHVTNPRFIPGSDLGDTRRRKAIVVDVRIDRFDFTMIGVHLKSGRGAAEQAIRDDQCKVIGRYVEDFRADQATAREDLLLVGDFNMIPGEDVSNFHHLGGADQMNFLSSWDLQARFSHILPAGRANLLDGFAISRTYSTEYIRGSLQLYPMHWTMNMGREKFRREVSDHLPFVATFRTRRSRD